MLMPWKASAVSSGNAGTKRMSSFASTPVETVTMHAFARMRPRSVSTVTPFPLQSMDVTRVERLTSEVPGAVGDQGAVAFLAMEVPSVVGVPPVEAGEGVEVLGHLVRADREVHQVVPASGVGDHRGRTHVPAPAPCNRYRADGVLVGGGVGGVLLFGRLSVADVEGLGVGGRIRGEPVVLRMLHEGVLPRAVQPVRSDVIGDPEQREVGVGAPPDPRARLQGGYRYPPAEQVPGGGEPGRARFPPPPRRPPPRRCCAKGGAAPRERLRRR